MWPGSQGQWAPGRGSLGGCGPIKAGCEPSLMPTEGRPPLSLGAQPPQGSFTADSFLSLRGHGSRLPFLVVFKNYFGLIRSEHVIDAVCTHMKFLATSPLLSFRMLRVGIEGSPSDWEEGVGEGLIKSKVAVFKSWVFHEGHPICHGIPRAWPQSAE